MTCCVGCRVNTPAAWSWHRKIGVREIGVSVVQEFNSGPEFEVVSNEHFCIQVYAVYLRSGSIVNLDIAENVAGDLNVFIIVVENRSIKSQTAIQSGRLQTQFIRI